MPCGWCYYFTSLHAEINWMGSFLSLFPVPTSRFLFWQCDEEASRYFVLVLNLKEMSDEVLITLSCYVYAIMAVGLTFKFLNRLKRWERLQGLLPL